MIYKKLGDTPISVPAIAQGASGMGSYKNFDARVVKDRTDALIYGIHHGLVFIDTAEMYGGGLSEEVVGGAIAGLRDKVFLASKFNQREDVEAALERSIKGSLARLKTDYLDLYQVHWPNPLIPIERVMEALYRICEQGKARYIGLSNFPVHDFELAQSCFERKIVSNQLEYNLLDRSVEETFLPYALERGVSLIAYSPLNQGRVFATDEQKSVLESLAGKYGKTVSQIVLRWLIAHDSVIPVSKMKNIARVKENLAAMEFDLESADIARLDAAPCLEPISVPAAEIRLIAERSDRAPYKTIDEAMENKLDLFPSPVALSRMIKDGYNKPIRLVATNDASGSCRYDIDQYDVMDQVKKYWAWIIAYGKDVSIPAFILSRTES